jgi:parallel beta-helix repeat protein
MKNRILRFVIAFIVLSLVMGALAWPSPVYAATYVVNTTDSRWDRGTNPCTVDHCSLWEAVYMANTHSGPDRITFNLSGDGPHVIYFRTESEGVSFRSPGLHVVDDETEIDATTQPGWPIYLHGLGEVMSGLTLESNRNAIRGLGFLGFYIGLSVEEGSENNFIDRVVSGDYLGGELVLTPIGNHTGIDLTGGNNTVRGASVANNNTGIWVVGSNEHIEDSHIGFISGHSSHRGNDIGIRLNGDGNTVERNTIIGNYEKGIWALSSGNIIVRNRIGLDTRGHLMGNWIGISLYNEGNQIGGTDPYEGNIIVDNDIGIWVFGSRNEILNNRIGTDFVGAALPNRIGVRIDFTGEGTLLGSGWYGAGNIIAYNTEDGVVVSETSQIVILHNTIHHNGGNGIRLETESAPPADGMKVTIKRNSIYNNGGMGIYIPVAAFNGNLEHPSGLRYTGSAVTGRACPGCRVEIFEAAPDPSGFGEGKTFLSNGTAGSDGSFSVPVSGLHACSQVTATATDELGNTSDFSLNVRAMLCFRLPSLVALIWVLGAAGAGSALVLVIVFRTRRLRHQPGPTSTIGLGLLGGILGAGIGIGLLAMPFVQIQWPQGRQGGQAPSSVPACSQFIDEALVQPENGKVFTQGTDVLFQLSPQPDPPGMQTRWFLDVTSPDNTTVSKLLSSNSISLSALGFDPKQTGFYLWKLRGEHSKTGSTTWTPLCTDSVQRMFRIALPTPVQPTATATVALTTTVTATPSTPTATLLQNAYCMRGPGATGYESLTTLFQGVQVPIEGRNQDGTWWYVRAPNSQARCWVAGTMVQTSGNVNGVPVVESPPSACWVKPSQGSDKCVSPCPEGAKPGGACTP